MKVFYDINGDIRSPALRHLLFLYFDNWDFTTVFSEAEVILIPALSTSCNMEFLDKNVEPHQTLVLLYIYHIDESRNNDWLEQEKTKYRHLTDKILIVHKNIMNKNNIYFDYMFNRQKIYCTDYREEFKDFHWTTGCNKQVYSYTPAVKTPLKKVLSLSRIYVESSLNPSKRMLRRTVLKELLGRYAGDCYLSDPASGIELLPNNFTEDMRANLCKAGGGGNSWYPVADSYYNTSYVSIYTESITEGNLFDSGPVNVGFVSEKTFDPMMKRHFVLPFGHKGMIQLIRNYGFILPDWIDYSYDTVDNHNERFEAYKNSVKEVMKYSLADLHNLYLKDFEMLEHNRQVFIDRPYDSLLGKIYLA